MTAANSKTCNIEFDGELSRETCASLSVEFICYILYQRQLIPMTYQHLQRELNKSKGDADEREVGMLQGRVGNTSRTSPRLRRAQQSMGELTLLFDNVRAAFSRTELPIGKLLMTLGASPMAPRETYQLCFPADRRSGMYASEANARSTLFRCLIEHDFIGCFSDLASATAPGSLTVLIEASRSAGIDWFQPFPAFRLPTRGKLFHVVMASRLDDSDASRLDDGDASAILDGNSSWPNVSGIEPLDCSGTAVADCTPPTDMAVGAAKPDQLPPGCGDSGDSLLWRGNMPLPSSRQSSAANGGCMEQELDSLETIWYRAPTTFKGFHHF